MIFLIHPNVVFEMTRKHPDAKVLSWFDRVSSDHVRVSVLTLGELGRGSSISSCTGGLMRNPFPHKVLSSRSFCTAMKAICFLRPGPFQGQVRGLLYLSMLCDGTSLQADSTPAGTWELNSLDSYASIQLNRLVRLVIPWRSV